MDTRESRRGLLLLVALAYTAFVVYGSLVPLNFRPMTWSAALDAFDALSLDPGSGSRIDWATNVVLAIPLAFFWTGVLWPARNPWWRLPAILVVFAGCLAVSFAVEFAQLFFPGRTTSLNDVAAQALGETIGIGLWWAFGPSVMRWVDTLPLVRGRTEIAQRLLVMYLFVLVGYNVLPLDLSVNPVELYRKWRHGGVVILPFTWPYSDRAQQLYELITDVAIWVPVAVLWRISSRQSNLAVWARVVVAAASIEFLQLFVMSRVSDSTDVVLAALGGGLGIALAQRIRRRQRATPADPGVARHRVPGHRAPGQWLLWLAGLLVWLAVLAVVFWYPFDFDLDPGAIRRRILGLKQVPLYAYWKGSPFRAVTEVLHKTGFLLPLGLILAGMASSLPRRVPRGLVHFAAVAFIAATATLIEAVQLALPRKNVDLTDWFLEVAGGIAGYVAFIVVRSRLRRPRKRSHASPA